MGYFPKAPGTMGTLAAVPLVALAPLAAQTYIILTIALTLLGIYASERAEKLIGKKDPGCIVIDEFCGYLTAMALLPITAFNLIAAFVLFRIFDILKPQPIKALQRLGGGLGVMADDIVAGLAANLILQGWRIWIER